MKLRKSWQTTEGYLDKAFKLLPSTVINNPEGGSVSEYKKYLLHNELELALDELEGLGEANDFPEEYWQQLFNAAKEMGLNKHKKRYLDILRNFSGKK